MLFPSAEQRTAVRKRPEGLAIMHQKWRDLFLIHWKCDPSCIQSTLPKGLYADTYNTHAYIGIAPFRMRHARPCFLPVIPFFSNFLTLNLRTYVYDEMGNPGIWHYSLDTNRFIASLSGRKFSHLPYYYAKMKMRKESQTFSFASKRYEDSSYSRFELAYENTYQEARYNSLEFFLLERYFFYAFANEKLYRTQVFHHPYLYSQAKILEMKQELFNTQEFNISKPDHVMFSPGVDVNFFPQIQVKQ